MCVCVCVCVCLLCVGVGVNEVGGVVNEVVSYCERLTNRQRRERERGEI